MIQDIIILALLGAIILWARLWPRSKKTYPWARSVWLITLILTICSLFFWIGCIVLGHLMLARIVVGIAAVMGITFTLAARHAESNADAKN